MSTEPIRREEQQLHNISSTATPIVIINVFISHSKKYAMVFWIKKIE